MKPWNTLGPGFPNAATAARGHCRASLAHEGRARRLRARQKLQGHRFTRWPWCLEACEEGPLVVAYRGKAAQQPQPPRTPWKKRLHPPLLTVTQAHPDKAHEMIEQILTTLTQKTGKESSP